jgi:hypothetical protein
MGCDIHAMVEAKRTYEHLKDCWSWQSCGRVNIARSYRLFAALAGVRNYDGGKPISEPRLSEAHFGQNWNDQVCSEDFAAIAAQWGPDGHSHSFVTVQELATVDAVLAAKCIAMAGAAGWAVSTARLTFFFDN